MCIKLFLEMLYTSDPLCRHRLLQRVDQRSVGRQHRSHGNNVPLGPAPGPAGYGRMDQRLECPVVHGLCRCVV